MAISRELVSAHWGPPLGSIFEAESWCGQDTLFQWANIKRISHIYHREMNEGYFKDPLNILISSEEKKQTRYIWQQNTTRAKCV